MATLPTEPAESAEASESADASEAAEPELTYRGARRPDRRRTVASDGIGLAVWEWGAPDAPPILLAHGGFDFAGTFDLVAPRLADAGCRVVSWDQRGHGDSDQSVLYSWDADLRDGLTVLDTLSAEPIPLVGHSKGGALMTQIADARPFRCSHLVNLDGLPSRRAWPDVPERERTRLLAGELRAWLDHRAASATKIRRPDTIDGLARRRQQMNPRLPLDWLRYVVPIGARHDPDGWRWKIDPVMRFGGFGPWRPEWMIQRIPGLGMPFLGVLGLESEPMGWGTLPEDVVPYLPREARFEALDGVGHFVHVERPDVVADLILDFVGEPARRGASWAPVDLGRSTARPATLEAEPTTMAERGDMELLVHNKVRLAIHRLRDGDDGGHPLLLLHGLGERSPAAVPPALAAWPGPVFALDFTGHGASTHSTGGGYSAEVLMADVDVALRHIGDVTAYGRGLGAYVALLLAGARADAVRGAILADGPGMLGGGPGPTAVVIDRAHPSRGPRHGPDPYAISELARDPRPPDYASAFARLAVMGSSLETPLAVVSVTRPDWLAATLLEPGVEQMSIDTAIDLYASAGS
ncbi:MAG: alpha/beta fold hydrolase [Acidimicrobiales bacterium]